MSLKEFFKNGSVFDSEKVTEVESSDELIQEYSKNVNRYIPEVDYSDPANFVRFGLAEEYYKDSVTRILEYYPYDGSLKDKLKWENDSLDLDLYIYKNLWPKTTGYANFSPNGWGTDSSAVATTGYRLPNNPEYIFFKSGPNVDNTYESSSYTKKFSNICIDRYKGNTFEFWLKKGDFPNTTTTCTYIIESIIDIAKINTPAYRTNISIFTGTTAGLTTSAGYAGLSYKYNYQNSGSIQDVFILDNNWHHYCFTFLDNTYPNVNIKIYRDGSFLTSQDYSTTFSNTDVNIYGTIGSLVMTYASSPTGLESNTTLGYGKLSGSLDEVRIWNCARTSEEIYQYYNFIINGGTNNDDINSNLGIYYKFNEGITGDSTTDSIVLDYSGRNSNGLWTGYSSNSRSTGSAIIESELANYEPLDPIILSNHPEVVSLQENLETSGSIFDSQNTNNIYSFVPSWILKETEDIENNTTKNILQTVSTFLDEFHLKTEKVKELQTINYNDIDTHKINPFIHKSLLAKDLDVSELFLKSSLFEEINSKNEEIIYEEKIGNIKNFIYQNLYNNLVNIYKSKGTEYSIRNLLNSVGINSDLIKLNLYANNATYNYDITNYEQKITKKKFIKFSTNNSAYISSSSPDVVTPILVNYCQAEVLVNFPKINDLDSEFYTPTSIQSSSIAQVINNSDNSTWFDLYFVKENLKSKNGKFVLKIKNDYVIESNHYYDVYNDKNWLILFGINNQNYDSHFDDGDNFDFVGYLHCISENDNDFYTTNIGGDDTIDNNVSFQIGAFQYPSVYYSDVNVGAYRVYQKNYLDTNEGYRKFFDINNYGTYYPQENKDIFSQEYIPQDQTLLLNWIFDTITGSDDSGQLFVEDFSSGSNVIRYGTDSKGYSEIYNIKIPGTGSNFESNSANVFETLYIYNNQQKIPENLCSSDMISIISSGSHDNFKRDIRPISYIYSLEKSYYQNISQEMLNMFASIIAFNNIVGEPVQKFRQEYKSLNKLRNLFFEKMNNIPDIERYVDMYRWIDKSITDLIMNIIPASTNIIEDNENIIESHILERSKYRNKFVNFRNKLPNFLVNIKGIGESNYSWDNLGNKWSEYRKERTAIQLPVESGSLYHQKYDNIYDIKLTADYENYNPRILQNSSTIDFDILQFNSTKPNRPNFDSFDWSTVDTVECWDIYTLDYPNATPVSQIVGNYAGLVMTGSRESYSGSFYGPTYTEASNYPRSAWLTGSGTTVKKCISRAYNATSNYAVTYRVNGINPLSGSTNFTAYYVLGIYPGKAYPMLQAKRSINDGYFSPSRELILTKTSDNPGKITLSYKVQGGTSYTAFSGEGSDLIYHQFYLIVLVKNGLRFSLYTVGESNFTYFLDDADIAEEIWPCSNNLNIFGYGTYGGYTAENATFTWVSLHNSAHTTTKINKIVQEINRRQGFNFVPVS